MVLFRVMLAAPVVSYVEQSLSTVISVSHLGLGPNQTNEIHSLWHYTLLMTLVPLPCYSLSVSLVDEINQSLTDRRQKSELEGFADDIILFVGLALTALITL
jgi:hypothetical protein